jgi:chromate transporter
MDDRIEPGGTAMPPLVDMHPSSLSRWELLRIWLGLGLQSFGGGAATLFLMRRAAVERHHWLTEEEFTRDWSICFIAPGVNLIAMTILIGYRVAGIAGSLITLVGLLLPSVTITIMLTAFYASLQHVGMVQAALRGIVPATIGLGLLLSTNMARPLLATSWREGRMSGIVSLCVLLGSAAAMVVWQLPIFAVFCGAGAIAALVAWRGERRRATHND